MEATMSEQNQNEQGATPAELSEESLENVAGGIIDGGCIEPFPPVGCWPPLPTDPTVCF
jgi:hypothetical protein